MRLRKLELKDAPLMLEWMLDKDITADLQTDFSSKTIEDAECFIEKSKTDAENLQLAISSDSDEYMGTVSLKHINNVNAEFAISIRRTAMGKGYARYAMMSILKMAGNDYGLDYVYWCVNPDNKRAIRFYEKNGYARTNHTEIDIRGGTVQNKLEDISGSSIQFEIMRIVPIDVNGRCVV